MKLLVAVPVLFLVTACGSGRTPFETPIPTQPPATFAPSDPQVSSPSVVPALEQHTCAEFPTQAEAQAFFRESGGPVQDLHNLDPDHNGQACDEASLPAPAAVGGVSAPSNQGSAAVVAADPTPVPTPAGPPKSYSSSSGSVDGHHGGSTSNSSSSCNSSTGSGCK